MSLPPAGPGFCVVPLLPLNEAILLALLAPVHDLRERSDIRNSSFLLFSLLLLLSIRCQQPGSSIVLLKHLVSCLITLGIYPVSNSTEHVQVLLIQEHFLESSSCFLGLFKETNEDIRCDAVVQNRGDQTLDICRAILEQVRKKFSPLVHVLDLLKLLQPHLPTGIPMLLCAEESLVEWSPGCMIPKLWVALVAIEVRIVAGISTVQLKLLPVPLPVSKFWIHLRVSQIPVLIVRDPGGHQTCCLGFA
mmetsp:Transcript_42803/g.99934  ORF Transcript_42803/g.99934 Transcript_42803/m.99934 type:complete len:248 (-) Transcript_42803:450-1193(-)